MDPQLSRMPPWYSLHCLASTQTTTGPLLSLSLKAAQPTLRYQPLILNSFRSPFDWQSLGFELKTELRQGYSSPLEMPQSSMCLKTQRGRFFYRQLGQQSMTSCSERVIQLAPSCKVQFRLRYSKTCCLLTSNSISATAAKMKLPSQSLMSLTGGMNFSQSQQQSSSNSAISWYPFFLAIAVAIMQNSWNSSAVRLENSLRPCLKLGSNCFWLKMRSSSVQQKANLRYLACWVRYFWWQLSRKVLQSELDWAWGESMRMERKMKRRPSPSRRNMVRLRIICLVVGDRPLREERTVSIMSVDRSIMVIMLIGRVRRRLHEEDILRRLG